MSLLDWLVGHFSYRAKADARHRRGMNRAKKRDHQGAIRDYTAAIDMPNTPSDVKAMVFYHRALVHVAVGNFGKAVGDLESVLAMDVTLTNVRTLARQELARIETRSREGNARKYNA